MKAPSTIRFRKYFRCAAFSAIVLAGSADGVLAQQRSAGEHTVVGLHVYVPVEYQNIDAGKLNQYMGVAELPQVRIPGIFTGIGTQVQIDRIIVNASVAGAAKRYTMDNARMSAPFMTYGFTVGYDLASCPFISLQPYAGYRVGRMTYNYEIDDAQSAQAAGAYHSAPDRMRFRGSRGMFDLGLGLSWQSKLLLGLRGGVMAPVGTTKWRDGDGARLTGGPDLRFQYYLGVNLGFGRANIKVRNSSSTAAPDHGLDPADGY